MGQTKPSDRFPQGRAHIGISEKRSAPIGVDGEEIGATRHTGTTAIRHGGIIPPMNGAGTRLRLLLAPPNGSPLSCGGLLGSARSSAEGEITLATRVWL